MYSSIITPESTTETFTGTVQVGGSDIHQFTVGQQGNVSITLTQAGDPPTILMGLGVGQPPNATSTACVILSGGFVQTAAGTNAQLAGTAPAGLYCVQVVDIGQALAPINYTVTVVHPK